MHGVLSALIEYQELAPQIKITKSNIFISNGHAVLSDASLFSTESAFEQKLPFNDKIIVKEKIKDLVTIAEDLLGENISTKMGHLLNKIRSDDSGSYRRPRSLLIAFRKDKAKCSSESEPKVSFLSVNAESEEIRPSSGPS